MKPIVIKKIELSNYRQYLKQKIEFNYSTEKNISVIQGHNGTGKSNIFNAINWCFFGIEEHLDSEKKDKEPLCNTKVLDEIKQGKSVETKVAILIDTEDGEKILERKTKFSRNNSGSIVQENPIFTVQEFINNKWDISPYPEYVVSRILPKQMRNFFYIDGEKLRVLFENLKPEDVRNAIFDLSQINMLQNAIDHLKAYKSKLRREVKDEPELEKYQQKIEDASNEIEASRQEHQKIKNLIDDAQVIKNKIDSEIKDLGDQDVHKLEAERVASEDAITSLQTILESHESEFLNYLFEVAPIVICYDAIEKSLSYIESEQEKGIYPPPRPNAAVIDYILKNEKCFCTAELTEERRNALNIIKSQINTMDIQKDIDKLQTLLSQYVSDFQNLDSKVKMYNENIVRLRDQIENQQKKLKEIITRLGNTDIEKVNHLNIERSKFESQIKKGNNDLAMIKAKIELTAKFTSELEKKYNQQLSQVMKYQEINNKITLCEKCISIVSSIKEQVMKEVKQETIKYTRDFFHNLVSAKDFDSIDILEDYQLTVMRDNYNCLYSLSAAETLCMGYSFMGATRKSSGFLAPVVIDTPLAKVDSQYRANIASWFINSLGGAQVILLVTDTEYTNEFRNEIYNAISDQYRIKHDRTKRISEVVKDD